MMSNKRKTRIARDAARQERDLIQSIAKVDAFLMGEMQTSTDRMASAFSAHLVAPSSPSGSPHDDGKRHANLEALLGQLSKPRAD